MELLSIDCCVVNVGGNCQRRCERVTDRFKWDAQCVSVTILRVVLFELTVVFEGMTVNCNCSAWVLKSAAIETNKTAFFLWSSAGGQNYQK